MKLIRNLAVLSVAVAALVVPATVFAHGSVYTDVARLAPATDPNGPPLEAGELEAQTRHVVTNHGYTMVLRETNGATDKGMVDFSRMPGTYRNQPGFEPGASGTRTRLLSEGDTGAQPHATCRGVSALDAESAVLGWQDADPFYNYVPFQKAAAGLEDDPALWIEDVLALTGVNLGQVSDVAAQAATELEALCEAPAVGGTFYPADQTQTSTASLNSGFAHDLTTPLTAQIAQLQADLTGANAAQTSAQSSLAAQTSAKSSLEAQNTALTAQVAQLKLEATRLKINSVSGGSVKLAGPAGKAVTIKMTISKTVAKALKLKSRTLATATGKIGVDAAAALTIKPSGKAAAALSKKGGAKVTVTATCEDRVASTGTTLKG